MNKINAICFISAFCIFTFTIVGCDGGCKDTEITDTPDEGSTDQSQIQDQPSDLENIDSISSDSDVALTNLSKEPTFHSFMIPLTDPQYR